MIRTFAILSALTFAFVLAACEQETEVPQENTENQTEGAEPVGGDQPI